MRMIFKYNISMRILMLGPSIGDSYGTEQVIRHSGEGLKRRGHSVYFLAQSQNGDLPNFDGIHLLPLLFGVNSLSSRAVLKSLGESIRKIMDGMRPDIVHLMEQLHPRLYSLIRKTHPIVMTSHTVSTTSPSSCRLIRGDSVCEKRSGWACLVHHHHYGCLGYLKNDLRRLHAVYEYQIARRAHRRGQAFLGPSQYICDLLKHDGWNENRIHLVVNPVPAIDATPPPNAPQNLITTACRLVPMKGLDRLLLALGQIERIDWSLWIFGDGPERRRLEKLSMELNLNTRVFFKGLVPQRELHCALAGSRLYCQPNLGPESFGMAAAEASALSRPVVGFDVPGLNETVIHGRTGLLARRGDVLHLAQCLKTVLEDDSLAEQLGQAGRTHILTRFSLDAHLDALVGAYEGVLAKSRNSGYHPA